MVMNAHTRHAKMERRKLKLKAKLESGLL